MMAKRQRGFTLTEILVTIVIMAVIAAMILPRFSGQQERAIVAEAVGVLNAIRQAEAVYYLEHGAYTSTLAGLAIEVPTTANFEYRADIVDNFTWAWRKPINGGCTGSGANPYGGCTMGLWFNGTWAQSSTHPFTPTN